MRPVRLGWVGICNRMLTISLPLRHVGAAKVAMRELTIIERLRVLFGAPIAMEIKMKPKR